jgi:hypothetical protein
LYVIADIAIRRDMPAKRLLGYRLSSDGYEQLVPNADGWLWLAPVNLWLGWHGEDIACYDRDGNLIEDYIAVTVARAEAEGRAAEAEGRAAEAEERATEEAEERAQAESDVATREERIRKLEEELRRLRGNRNHQ